MDPPAFDVTETQLVAYSSCMIRNMILENDEGNNVVRLWQNDWMPYMLLEGSIGYPPSDTQHAVNHPRIEFNDLARFLDLTL